MKKEVKDDSKRCPRQDPKGGKNRPKKGAITGKKGGRERWEKGAGQEKRGLKQTLKRG